MGDDGLFAELLARVRAGDERACAEFVGRYEREVRLEVRFWLRLRDRRLRRVIDSVDIVQSVMASFFARATGGEFNLDDAGQLQRLLATMARNKLADWARAQQRRCRDIRRVQAEVGDLDLVGDELSPSRRALLHDLVHEVRDRLTDEEWQLAQLRAEGREWAAIAAELGGTPDARRKQFARAIARVAQQLGRANVGGD